MPSRSCVVGEVFLPLSHDSLHIRVLCSVGDLVQSTRSGSRCGLYDTLVPGMGNKGDDIDVASLKESDVLPRKSTISIHGCVLGVKLPFGHA